MGSSHPDDVDQLPVPGDPGPPDETAGLLGEPADWDDAWLPEWLGDEPDGTPPVEDAAPAPAPAPAPEPDVVPEPEPDATQPDATQPDATQPDAAQPDATQADVAPEPEPDAAPDPDAGQPDAGLEPDVDPEPDADPELDADPGPDAEHQPDAGELHAPEPDPEPLLVATDDRPTADLDEGPVPPTTADAGPAEGSAEPAGVSEAISVLLQPAPVRVVVGSRTPSRRRALSGAAGLLVAGAVAAASLLATRGDTPVPAADAAAPTTSAPAVSGRATPGRRRSPRR